MCAYLLHFRAERWSILNCFLLAADDSDFSLSLCPGSDKTPPIYRQFPAWETLPVLRNWAVFSRPAADGSSFSWSGRRNAARPLRLLLMTPARSPRRSPTKVSNHRRNAALTHLASRRRRMSRPAVPALPAVVLGRGGRESPQWLQEFQRTRSLFYCMCERAALHKMLMGASCLRCKKGQFEGKKVEEKNARIKKGKQNIEVHVILHSAFKKWMQNEIFQAISYGNYITRLEYCILRKVFM